MDIHQVLAQHYNGTFGDATAFSALPDAPVQQERRSRIRALLGSLRTRARTRARQTGRTPLPAPACTCRPAHRGA